MVNKVRNLLTSDHCNDYFNEGRYTMTYERLRDYLCSEESFSPKAPMTFNVIVRMKVRTY